MDILKKKPHQIGWEMFDPFIISVQHPYHNFSFIQTYRGVRNAYEDQRFSISHLLIFFCIASNITHPLIIPLPLLYTPKASLSSLLILTWLAFSPCAVLEYSITSLLLLLLFEGVCRSVSALAASG